jgi:hypothetical protein
MMEKKEKFGVTLRNATAVAYATDLAERENIPTGFFVPGLHVENDDGFFEDVSLQFAESQLTGCYPGTVTCYVPLENYEQEMASESAACADTAEFECREIVQNKLFLDWTEPDYDWEIPEWFEERTVIGKVTKTWLVSVENEMTEVEALGPYNAIIRAGAFLGRPESRWCECRVVVRAECEGEDTVEETVFLG